MSFSVRAAEMKPLGDISSLFEIIEDFEDIVEERLNRVVKRWQGIRCPTHRSSA